MRSSKQLKELFELFIDNKKYSDRRRPETLRGYRHVFEFFLRQMPHIVYPYQLAPEVVNTFMKQVQTRTRIVGKGELRSGIKDSTARTYLNKLDTFFRWLVTAGHLEKNPILEKGKYPQYNDVRTVSGSDIRKLYTAITLSDSNLFVRKRDTAMLSTLIYLGLRRGELVGLQVPDLDMERRNLKVRAETSKSKATRVLPVNDTLYFHLKDYLEERKNRKLTTEFLFASSNQDRGITKHGLKHWVEKLKKRAGVTFHLHKFRHTFACGLGKSGASEIKVQLLLGHTDPRMTRKYLRSLGVEDYRDAVNNLTIEHFS